MYERKNQVLNKIQVHDLRISFFWFILFPDLINGSKKCEMPYAAIGNSSDYENLFNQILKGDCSKGFKLPWIDLSINFFWKYYLEGGRLGMVNGRDAWKHIIPLRRKVPASVEAPWFKGRLIVEALFYPHGIAFMLTAYYRENVALKDAIEVAFQVRRLNRFWITWEATGESESLSLDVLANKILDTLSVQVVGTKPSYCRRSSLPFSVVTIIKGKQVDYTKQIPIGGDINRTLEALTSWRPTWEHDVLPSLSERKIRIKTSAPLSHILYGYSRGRVVWFPCSFIKNNRTVHTLSCYHRNLLLTSMQVESLCWLVSMAAESIRNDMPLPVTQRECSRRAAGILGRLYGGKDTTYQSWSPRIQIEQNNLVDDLNIVRTHFDLDRLV